MLWAVVVGLVVLWAAGVVTSTTMGGSIHLLLVAAAVVALFRILGMRQVPLRIREAEGEPPPRGPG